MYEVKHTPHLLQEQDLTIVQYTVYKCQGRNEKVWIYILYAGVILTQLLAFFFAVRLRKVHIQVLNDSKYMAVIIYLSTMIIIVMLVGIVALDDFINADAAVFAGGVMLYTSVVLCLTFIPKVRTRSSLITFISFIGT